MTDHHKYAEVGFQDHYQAHYGTTGRSFIDYQPAYEYGWDSACDGVHRGHDWTAAVEREVRMNWHSEHPDMAWDDMKDAIREGYRLGHRSMSPDYHP